MKKIPESYILEESEIKEAILDWLNQVNGTESVDFEVQLSVELKANEGRIATNQIIVARATRLG
jgi:hypothetical protein